MADGEHSVQTHYRSAGLLDRILAGLKEAGKSPDAPTIDDLAPADEFHSLGRVATRELAGLAAFAPGTRVLDAPILAWQQANIPPAGAAPPLGMHLVLGERHAEKRANSSRALRDGRISYIQGVFAKQ